MRTIRQIGIALIACLPLVCHGGTYVASTKLEHDAYQNFYTSTFPFFQDMGAKASLKEQGGPDATSKQELDHMYNEFGHVPITPVQDKDAHNNKLSSPEEAMQDAKDTYVQGLTQEQKVRLNNKLQGVWKPSYNTIRKAFTRTSFDDKITRRIAGIQAQGRDPHHIRDCLQRYHALNKYPNAFSKEDTQHLQQDCNPSQTANLLKKEMEFFHNNSTHMPREVTQYSSTIKNASNPRWQFISDNTSFARRWIQYPIEWTCESIGLRPSICHEKSDDEQQQPNAWKPKDYYHVIEVTGNVLYWVTRIGLNVWLTAEEQKRREKDERKNSEHERNRRHASTSDNTYTYPEHDDGTFATQTHPEHDYNSQYAGPNGPPVYPPQQPAGYDPNGNPIRIPPQYTI